MAGRRNITILWTKLVANTQCEALLFLGGAMAAGIKP
jgi:hypothetical protein